MLPCKRKVVLHKAITVFIYFDDVLPKNQKDKTRPPLHILYYLISIIFVIKLPIDNTLFLYTGRGL